MALGRPVIAPREGGPLVIVVEGETGLLVPPRDERGVADAVCALLQDPELAHSLGAEGMRTAEQYSWPRVAEQILDFYAKTGQRTLTAYQTASMAAWSPLS